MLHVLFGILALILMFRYGDWRNWGKYHSTILFYIIGNLVYNFFTYNYSLWEYESEIFKHTFSDLIIAGTIFPTTVLIFLYHFPEKRITQISYILIWDLVYITWEGLLFLFDYISYHNGWHMGWSFAHNLIMFLLLRLHQKTPLLTYFISVVVAFLVLFLFDVPFNLMK